MPESQKQESPEKKKQKIDSFTKKLNKTIEEFEKFDSLSNVEKEKSFQITNEKEKNAYAWWKVDPATKALIIVNGILTFILIVITAITVYQQRKTNALTEDNLRLFQSEFELTYRPYIGVEDTKLIVNKDSTITLSYIYRNTGNIPAIIKFKYDIFKKNGLIKDSLKTTAVLFPNQTNVIFTKIYNAFDNIPKKYILYIDYKSENSSGFIYNTTYEYNIDVHNRDIGLISSYTH